MPAQAPGGATSETRAPAPFLFEEPSDGRLARSPVRASGHVIEEETNERSGAPRGRNRRVAVWADRRHSLRRFPVVTTGRNARLRRTSSAW